MIESRNFVNPYHAEYVVVGPLNKIVYRSTVYEDAAEMAMLYTRSKNSLFTVVTTKPVRSFPEQLPKSLFRE